MTTTRLPSPSVLGDDRYQLDTASGRRLDGTLTRAHDTRLGRDVLLRWTDGPARAGEVAARVSGLEHPAVARVLDAGDAAGSSYTVFAFLDWPTLAQVEPAGRPASVAGIAAWLVAAYATAQSRCGQRLAAGPHDVLVDPRVVTGDLPAGECPIRWLPGPATGGDDLATVVAGLGVLAGRRARRRFAVAVDLLALPHGRRQALGVLAGIAGLEPRLLGLPPAASHQSSTAA